MKLSNFLPILPFVAAHGLSQHCSSHYPNDTVPEECCCMTYKASCTMNMERMFHIKIFYNRKQGITPDEFNSYWANNHSALAEPFHLRLGVVKYSQYHSTPDFRDLGRVEGALPILEFDGAAEFWVHNLETFQAMGSDPEYLGTIQPDDANFIDLESMRMVIGVDYIVLENQNAVREHGRAF
ncbi:EthD domain-containing protein [Ilyonectria destructans]|nr:EthD domain-containing protein [Ilyonectria destructans]